MSDSVERVSQLSSEPSQSTDPVEPVARTQTTDELTQNYSANAESSANATPAGGHGTFTVELNEAPRDVLVFLADRQSWFTAAEIAEAVAPEDADEPEASTTRALSLLSELGYVLRGNGRWWATRSGINAVQTARVPSPSSVVSPQEDQDQQKQATA